MLQLIYCLFFFVNFLQAEETSEQNPLVNLEGEPSVFVNNCVNVITGDFVDSQVDMVLPGSEPFNLQRVYHYFSADEEKCTLGRGWNLNFDSQLEVNTSGKKIIGTLEQNGGHISFYKEEKYAPECVVPIKQSVLRKGVTNTGSGEISARSNIRNLRLTYEGGEKKRWRLHNGAGVIKYFSKENGKIEKEVFPAGNKVLYNYKGKDLKLVNFVNSAGKVMSSYRFDRVNHRLDVYTINDQVIRYHFDKGRIVHVERPNAPWEKYTYKGGAILCKEHPDGRYVKTQYKNAKYKNEAEVEDKRTYRIHAISEPAGVDEKPIDTYRFEYDFRHRCTHVWNAYNTKTIYYYNLKERISKIDKCDKNGNAYYRDQLYWNGHQLAARLIVPEARFVLAGRTYSYDERGNVLAERLYGNLSGQCAIGPEVTIEGVPVDNGCEYYEKRFAYSNDGFNLLVYEEEGPQAIKYLYYPNNDMLCGKIYYGNGKVYKREFFEYNGDLALSKHIVDDGTSENSDDLTNVTERHITNYAPRLIFPVGLPEIVEEKCLDLATGQEILVSRTIHQYTNEGLLASQTQQDSHGNDVFTLYWKYDRNGNVIEQTDAIGQTIIRNYDDNNNLVYECGPDVNVSHFYEYDFMNRLIKESELHSDRSLHVKTYAYDLMGNLIVSTDPYGHRTVFEYDEFGRVIKTIQPQILNQYGVLYHPISFLQYDWVDNITQTIDARSVSKQTAYNLRKQPTLIAYPDGTSEQNIYNLDGSVQTSVKRDGTYSLITYDYCKRPVKQEYYSRDGVLIETTSATYNTFHLTSETDASGLVTYYEYNPQGKVSRKLKGNAEERYVYDAMGRVHKTIQVYGHSPEEIILQVQDYDLLNRVIEERTEDYAGNVLTRASYRYDVRGNRDQVILYNLEGTSVTTTYFDSHNDPVLIVDPEGNQTVTRPKFDFFNEHGQNVPCYETIDPKGTITTTTLDGLGRIHCVTRTSKYGHLLQKQEKRYDAAGNMLSIINLNQNKNVTTLLEHDHMNQLTRMVEAWGTPEQRTTVIQYCAQGKKSHHIKPDGTILYYSYDSLGHLTGYNASDDSFSYVYEYDKRHNPISIKDLIHNTITHKIYDANGYLIEEKLGNGLALSYTYDRISRPLSVTLPDNTQISYRYFANQMKQVNYGKFTHEYQTFDQSGNLLCSKMIGDAGHINYIYDSFNRRRKTYHSKWEETSDYFDNTGNLNQKTVRDSNGTLISEFTYDYLNQVVTEAGGAWHTYEYDSLNNCVAKDGKQQSYNVFNMQLNDETGELSYDINGNWTARSHEIMKYDALNRLIEHTRDDHERTCYVYDSENRRLSKSHYVREYGNWTHKSTQRFIYQGKNEIGSCDEQGNVTELRILGMGQGCEAGATVAIKIEGRVYAPLHDNTGSLACLLDSQTGEVVESYRYSAFGVNLFSNAISPWLFSGKRFDEETGFVYFGQRYYNPTTSRWITTDPIGTRDGPNLYTYVHNCPLTYFDAYGFETETISSLFERYFSNPEQRPYEFNPVRSLSTLSNVLYTHAKNRFLGREPEVIESKTFNRFFCKELGFPIVGDYYQGTSGVGFMNGIKYSRADQIKVGEELSTIGYGIPIDLTQNRSKGFFVDVPRALLECVFHIRNPAIDKLHADWDYFFEKHPDKTYLQFSHSEGSADVRNALLLYDANRRKQIISVAIAPSSLIEDHLCGESYHYISKRDFVYFIGAGSMPRCSQVYFLTPHADAPLHDHGFLSPTFSKHIRDHMISHQKQFLKK